jgi:hypothetical protein
MRKIYGLFEVVYRLVDCKTVYNKVFKNIADERSFSPSGIVA